MKTVQFYKLILTLIVGLITISSYAQGGGEDMADAMRESGKIYVVVSVLVIIFAGISFYLFYLDRKISKLEKEVENK